MLVAAANLSSCCMLLLSFCNEDELFVHISIAVYVLGRYKLYHLENLNIYEVYEEKMNNEK